MINDDEFSFMFSGFLQAGTGAVRAASKSGLAALRKVEQGQPSSRNINKPSNPARTTPAPATNRFPRVSRRQQPPPGGAAVVGPRLDSCPVPVRVLETAGQAARVSALRGWLSDWRWDGTGDRSREQRPAGSLSLSTMVKRPVGQSPYLGKIKRLLSRPPVND